jgi:hypothetical protein
VEIMASLENCKALSLCILYEGESVSRLQMDVKRNTYDIRT